MENREYVIISDDLYWCGYGGGPDDTNWCKDKTFAKRFTLAEATDFTKYNPNHVVEVA